MQITKEIAEQLAVMVLSGMPMRDAIPYFFPDVEPDQVFFGMVMAKWAKSREYQAAIKRLQGKTWDQMTTEERLKYAINKHYDEVAYFLYSNNYAELDGARKQKADTCREAIERKLAGLAGKTDALTRFFDDIQSGKVVLRDAPKKATVMDVGTA